MYIMFISKLIIMGIGDWGLGIGPNPQSPIPNPLNNKSNKNIQI